MGGSRCYVITCYKKQPRLKKMSKNQSNGKKDTYNKEQENNEQKGIIRRMSNHEPGRLAAEFKCVTVSLRTSISHFKWG